jgi:hypothetical protein
MVKKCSDGTAIPIGSKIMLDLKLNSKKIEL